MIDSHCHFDLPEFAGKQQAVLVNCAKIGIQRILIPGLSLAQFKPLLSLQKQLLQTNNPIITDSLTLPAIDICLGCHPYFLKHLNELEIQEHQKQLFSLGKQHASDIVGIGECGLDASLALPMHYQEIFFKQQIALATLLNKPLVIHHRQSHNQLIRILKQEHFSYGGIIHAFSGSQQIAKTYIDMGFLLGVGGTITYPRAKKTRTTIANIELNHLLLETDAPDMPINGFQGEANSPEKLPLVAECLAQLQGTSVTKVQEQTTKNYKTMFGLN